MSTEEEIIYAIWDIVRAGESNHDDPINERLMRSFLRIHRGKHLLKNSNRGEQVSDEFFQNLGNIPFTLENGEYKSVIIPKSIGLGGFGCIAEKDDYVVSLLESGEWRNSKYDKFGQYHPTLKSVDDRMVLYIGKEQQCSDGEGANTPLNRAVRKFLQESQSNSINLDLRLVLVNPDDEPGYDFTTSQYPFPDELIEDLINSVTARDFNLFLRTKSDETGDNRHNVAESNTREEL